MVAEVTRIFVIEHAYYRKNTESIKNVNVNIKYILIFVLLLPLSIINPRKKIASIKEEKMDP